MLQSMIDPIKRRIKLEASATAWHYGGRAAVAVPFAVAAGFAVAAITVALSYAVGPVAACAIVAAAFAGLGVACYMWLKEQERQHRIELFRAREESEITVPPIVPLLASAGPRTLLTVFRTARRMPPVLVGALVLGAFMLFRRSDNAAERPMPAE